MIVAGQTEARASTIMDYHGPFDQGLTLGQAKIKEAFSSLRRG